MTMVEGPSVRFKYAEQNKGIQQANIKGGYDIVEVSPEVAARSRYYGDVAYLDEDTGVVAIFLDPVTGRFYGQPM